MSFGFGQTIVICGWYLQVSIIFYLMFYLSFRWTKTIASGIAINVSLISAYCIVCQICKLPSLWYECSFAMIAGMLISLANNKLSKMKTSQKIMTLAGTGLLFAFSFVIYYSGFFSKEISVGLKMVSSVSFATMIYCACHYISFKSNVLNWLGTHYLEIYVLQGIGLLLAERLFGKDEPYLFFAFSFTITIILAAIFKKPIGKYMALVKK